MARIDDLLRNYRLLQERRYQATVEARKEGRKFVLRIGDRDPLTGQYRVIHPSGATTTNGVKIFNASYPVGQVVRGTQAIGQPTVALDWRNAPKQQEFVRVEEAIIRSTSAIPILFTRLNASGDREFWLGGDRDVPILLDTFAPLSLITNDWLDDLSTVVSPPSRSISGALSATTTSGGFTTGLFYTTTVSLNIPTYVLAKLTGTLTTDLHMSASASTFVSGLSVSQIDDRTGESIVATESEVVTTDTLGAPSATVNQGGMLLLAPSNLELYLDINIATSYSEGGSVASFSPPSTGTIDVTATYEFIPCYLSATATRLGQPGKRFVLLQPEPGVLNYYEIEADSNDFVKTTFTAPDPVATDPEDWRSPFASHTQLTPPFNLGTPCENPYLFEYAPNTQLVFDVPFSRYASNIFNSNLSRIDGFQGGDYSKLYQRFQAVPGGVEVLFPLVNTQDVDLEIAVSTLEVSGASCTVGTPETQTVTAKSLGTPDALLLAIAPIVT